jgi:membrane-associated phospholipid phosphatase
MRPDVSWPVQMLIGLAVTAALVAVTYFYVDRPVTFYFRDHAPDHGHLKWVTRLPETLLVLSPVVLVAGLIRRRSAPWTRPQKAAVAAAASTLLTAPAVALLKITFGRYCPELAIAKGPSLLHGGAYGFNLFHAGAAYWAFPSGHTACTLSALSVAMIALPGWRLLWWSVAGLVAAVLVVLNYHFVGDVIAGAFLGWAVGGTVARRLGVGEE